MVLGGIPTRIGLIERDAEEERGGEALGIGEVGKAETRVDRIGKQEKTRLRPKLGGSGISIGRAKDILSIPKPVVGVVGNETQVDALEISHGPDLPIGIEQREMVGETEKERRLCVAAFQPIGRGLTVGNGEAVGIAALG